MTTKENTKPKIKSGSRRLIEDELNIPTLTLKVESDNLNVSESLDDFDIIEDFIPGYKTITGHKEGCSCISCQPLKSGNSTSPLASLPIEGDIKPLNRKKFRN